AVACRPVSRSTMPSSSPPGCTNESATSNDPALVAVAWSVTGGRPGSTTRCACLKAADSASRDRARSATSIWWSARAGPSYDTTKCSSLTLVLAMAESSHGAACHPALTLRAEPQPLPTPRLVVVGILRPLVDLVGDTPV